MSKTSTLSSRSEDNMIRIESSNLESVKTRSSSHENSSYISSNDDLMAKALG